MILLESDKPLGTDAHRFYDSLIRKVEQDKKHVQYVQDFWGDTLTAAGSQSADAKSAFVQVFLDGDQGGALANQSVDAVRTSGPTPKPPPGVKAYVAGAAPLIADQFEVGSKSTKKVTGHNRTGHRDHVACCLPFIGHDGFSACHGSHRVGRGPRIRRFSGYHGVIRLSTYSTNILTLLVIAAGTDYAIFLVGRYHEARQAEEGREDAHFTACSRNRPCRSWALA